jgi:hypothetical protein
MRRLVILAVLLLAPAAAAAQTVNVRDIVELSKAGLGDEALLALIEVNQPIFTINAETLKGLKEAGVAPDVITAMIRSGRTPPVPAASAAAEPLDPPPSAPAPQVVVIDHHDEEPQIREVPVAVPVYVPVVTRSRHRGDRIDRGDDHTSRPPVSRPVDPVFWGFDGKLRPDAWKPTAADVQKDARVPRVPQRK